MLAVASLSGIGVPRGLAFDPGSADPEDGTLVDGVYTNPYFALRYPLPPGWKAGAQPPRPSYAGYYVLSTPAPAAEAKATVLVAAQDVFFAVKPIADAMAMAKDLADSLSEADRATLEPSVVTIAGHSFARVGVSGSPLSRIVFATDIRCHVVIFTFTAVEPERLEEFAVSLDHLSLRADAPGSTLTDPPFPVCVKGYATAENILRKVEPVSVGPRFLRIPVRIVIGTDGRVKHTHVIRASSEQRKSIEDALARWEFRPYQASGHPVELETGLVFEFRPAN